MARRAPMSDKNSRKQFKRGVKREHSKNRMNAYWMRGGIRL